MRMAYPRTEDRGLTEDRGQSGVGKVGKVAWGVGKAGKVMKLNIE